MDLLNQISGIASLGSLILSRPGAIRRGIVEIPVNLARTKSHLPYRATENRRGYDALFRLDLGSTDFRPIQNDEVLFEGEEWIVWRIVPSAAGSHTILECMAPPTIGIIALEQAETPDGVGGWTSGWLPLTDDVFYGKVREAGVDRQLTATTSSAMGRLSLSYRGADAPSGFDHSWRVMVDGKEYEVLSVTVDDENPMWRNAVLSRENL